MREIFPPVDQRDTDPGRVFYTIRREDTGKGTIATEIGPIHVSAFMGLIRSYDVGKRLVRTPNNASDLWFWQLESNSQLRDRLNREAGQG